MDLLYLNIIEFIYTEPATNNQPGNMCTCAVHGKMQIMHDLMY